MLISRGEGDLYHRYRPMRFSEIIGHSEIVKSLKTVVLDSNRPRVFLFSGASGAGKTTAARILSLALNCKNKVEADPCLECSNCSYILGKSCTDTIEVNAADTRGIDHIRELCRIMVTRPLVLSTKTIILDEAHSITSDAQNSLLKELEEAPSHACYILCSTNPHKIIPTVRNRCQTYNFDQLSSVDISLLLENVSALENVEISENIKNSIVSHSEGSPRHALTLFQKIINVEENDALRLLEEDNEDEHGIIPEICIPLTSKSLKWGNLVKGYEKVKHLGSGTIGMTTAGFLRNKILKAKSLEEAEMYYKMIQLYLDPFPEGKVGENKLVAALFSSFQLNNLKIK